jgi:atypical dual specificity phosphatase
MSTTSSMTEIIDNLWVGNLKARNNISLLKKNNIGLIINCARKSILDKYSINDTSIPQIHLGIRDKNDIKSDISLLNKLEDVILVIDKFLKKKIGVLVHCYAGKQRSPAVITAYLISKKDMKYQQALEYIKFLWDKTGTNYEFALKRFESKINT